MRLCERDYADFVIWRESELVVLRIGKGNVFIEEAIYKATDFFKYGVLPELFSRWYTRNPLVITTPEFTNDLNNLNSNSPTTEDLFCFCSEDKDDELIGCDGDSCSVEWFHMKCLRIKRVPKGKWYCPDGRVKRTKSKT